MNTQLIPVFAGEIQSQSVQLVDARLLHGFLESAQDFSDWIKNRISEYGFIENIDFLLHKFREQKGRGGHNKIDYHLTLDMAKELSMVERNEKGKQARRYFIECERLLVTKEPSLPKPETLPINGSILCEIREGQIVNSEVLPKGAMMYNPRSAQSINFLVTHYIPVQQLGILLDATMIRMREVALGKLS